MTCPGDCPRDMSLRAMVDNTGMKYDGATKQTALAAKNLAAAKALLAKAAALLKG